MGCSTVEPGNRCGEGRGHRCGYEVADRTTVPGDLSHEAAADETPVDPAGQVHGTYAGDRVVGQRHLLLDLEVGRVAQPLDDEVDPGDARCRVHRQTAVAGDRHVVADHPASAALARDQVDALVDAEHARRASRGCA